MPPGLRKRITASATSGDSVPLAKRRRVDVVVDSKEDPDKRNILSPSMDSSFTAGSEQKVAGFDTPHTTPPANCGALILVKEPDTHLSLLEPFCNIVTIECGGDLKAQYKIDLALLCAQSKKQLEIFTRAEALYDQNVKAKALKKRAKAFHPLLVVHQIMQMDNSRSKALDFIMESFEKFPISAYHSFVAGRITEVVDTLFQKNELLNMPPTKGKKLDRSNYPKEDVFTRLELLNTEALLTVVERICLSLSQIKLSEKSKAMDQPTKTAAYRRVLLPNAKPEVVLSIVKWLSNEDLSFADAKHILRVHEVSHDLGITNLTAQCMGLLCSAMTSIIERSRSAGMTLRDVLNGESHTRDSGSPLDPLATTDVVIEIFHYTLATENPPAALRTLVVNAIVECEDEELLVDLMEKMASDMKGEVAVATMRKIKRNNGMATRNDPHQGRPDLSSSPNITDYREPQASSDTTTDGSIKSEVSEMRDEWNMASSEGARSGEM